MKILTPKLVLESARGRGFAEGDRSSRGGGHAPPPEIFILFYFFLDTVYIIVVRMECFFVRGGSLSSILTT